MLGGGETQNQNFTNMYISYTQYFLARKERNVQDGHYTEEDEEDKEHEEEEEEEDENE